MITSVWESVLAACNLGLYMYRPIQYIAQHSATNGQEQMGKYIQYK